VLGTTIVMVFPAKETGAEVGVDAGFDVGLGAGAGNAGCEVAGGVGFAVGVGVGAAPGVQANRTTITRQSRLDNNHRLAVFIIIPPNSSIKSPSLVI